MSSKTAAIIRLATENGVNVDNVSGRHHGARPVDRAKTFPLQENKLSASMAETMPPPSSELGRRLQLNGICDIHDPKFAPSGWVGFQAIKGGRDATKRRKRDLRPLDGPGILKRPDGRHSDLRFKRDRLDGGGSAFEVRQDAADGLINLAHGAEHIRNSEEIKSEFRNGGQDFENPKSYADDMQELDSIAVRIGQIQKAFSGNQRLLSERAERGEATISALLSQKAQKNTGKPLKPTLRNLLGLSKATGIPIWAMLHWNRDIFMHYLRHMTGESAESAVAAALSIVAASTAEGTAAEAAWLESLDHALVDGRSRKEPKVAIKKAGTA